MNSISSAKPHPSSTSISERDRPQFDARERALVLGGGGSAGNAWLIGVIAGLFDAGLDVTRADLVIGTSAGATTAVQLAGASPPELLAAVLAAPQQPAPPAGSARDRVPTRPAVDHIERTGKIIASASDAHDMRWKMGAAALELDTASDGSGSRQWRATVAARLPDAHWPQGNMFITAVDARSGEPVIFDRQSGVDLIDAVAASTSSGPAYRIGDDRYIDGGYRRNENADLAAGYRRVLVFSPLGGRTRHPLEWGMQLAAQVDELRAGGSAVETVLPDRASLDAMGPNLMDVSTRPAVARAGFDQGYALAEKLTAFWR